MVFLEEGKLPHLWFPHCNIMVLWEALNYLHPTTAQCAKGAERKRRSLAEYYIRARTERALHAYIRPLNLVTLFKYLGLTLTTSDDDCPAVAGNLSKARKSWERLLRILGPDLCNPWVSGMFFKEFVQTIILFVS